MHSGIHNHLCKREKLNCCAKLKKKEKTTTKISNYNFRYQRIYVTANVAALLCCYLLDAYRINEHDFKVKQKIYAKYKWVNDLRIEFSDKCEFEIKWTTNLYFEENFKVFQFCDCVEWFIMNSISIYIYR